MPTGEPGSPEVRAKTMSWVAWCRPRVEPLLPVDAPTRRRRRTAVVSRKVASEPWFGSVRPKARRRRAVEEAGHPLGLLLLGAEVAHHQHGREVADDRALVLQVVVQPEALGGQVLADDRHLEVGGVAAAELGRQRQPQPPGRVGPAAHLAQQLLPLRARDAAVLEVGAGPLAPVVEEADVVVLLPRAA